MEKEKLIDKIIRLSDEYVREIYPLTLRFPKYEMYALGDQLRRSLVSIPSNAIEGYRQCEYPNIYRKFLLTAYGSLGEAKYQTYLAYKMGYLDEQQFEKLKVNGETISKLLWSLIKTIKKRKIS